MWIKTNAEDLINLEHVALIYRDGAAIKFEFEVGPQGENEREDFKTEEEAEEKFKEYIAKVLN
jgi:hypothetical protein